MLTRQMRMVTLDYLALASWLKARRHAQNRKYMTYRDVARGEPSQGRTQHAQNMVKFDRAVYKLCERTDRQTNRHTHRNISHPSRYV